MKSARRNADKKLMELVLPLSVLLAVIIGYFTGRTASLFDRD